MGDLGFSDKAVAGSMDLDIDDFFSYSRYARQRIDHESPWNECVGPRVGPVSRVATVLHMQQGQVRNILTIRPPSLALPLCRIVIPRSCRYAQLQHAVTCDALQDFYLG